MGKARKASAANKVRNLKVRTAHTTASVKGGTKAQSDVAAKYRQRDDAIAQNFK